VASKKSPRISLCMIVRNEEEVLHRCLESASPWVDEIIIVDTGSDDRSVEIAREFGAQVHEHPWEDDFSAARNAALGHATGEWILSLDADEVLSPKAGKELRRVVRKKQYVGAYIPLRDQRDGGKETVCLMFRAFQNRPEIRWHYRLHEQVLLTALDFVRNQGMHIAQLSGEIIHDGYREEVMEAKGKDERNRRIYALQLLDTPNDLYVLYKYADFLRRNDDTADQAAEPLERAYAIMQETNAAKLTDYTFTGEACALLALHHQRRGENTETLAITTFGIEHCRQSAHLWYAHGNALALDGQWAEAAAAYQQCASCHGKPMHIPPQAQITGRAARQGMIKAQAHLGEVGPASDAAWKLVQDDPEDETTIQLWVEVATLEENWSQLTSRLIERIQQYPNCGTTWFKGGELFFRLRLFDQAQPWILRAAELLDDAGPAYGLHGECLLAAGHYEQAVDAFVGGVPGDLRCRAGLLLMSLAYGIDLAEPVDPADEALWSEVRRMVSNLHDLGHDSLHHLLHAASTSLEETDPAAHALLEGALA